MIDSYLTVTNDPMRDKVFNALWGVENGRPKSQSHYSEPSGVWSTRTAFYLAVIIFLVIAFPWPPPSQDLRVTTFDPAFITVDSRGFLSSTGQIQIKPKEIMLTAHSHSQPTVHLLTAEVPFEATLSVSIAQASPKSFPFQLKIWSPRKEIAVEAWYGADRSLLAGTRVGDQWERVIHLGKYDIGDLQTWRVVRNEHQIILEVTHRDSRAQFVVNRPDYPILFGQDPVSLTIYASAPNESTSIAMIRNPQIVVPHQGGYGTTVESLWFRPFVGLVALLSLIWTGVWTRKSWKRPTIAKWDFAVVMLLLVVSLMTGWLASKVPGQPYDIRSLMIWTHTAREHGLAAITGYSLAATENNAHGGQPYAVMTFPYPPILTYSVWLAGKVAPPEGVEQAHKMLVMLSLAVGGGILFAIFRKLSIDLPLAAFATGAYVLNPAVLFDVAVWGQTDPVVAMFLLIGTIGIVLASTPAIWIGAFLAFLTKQSGGAFTLILIALGLLRLGPKQMVRGLPLSIIIVFLVLSPAFLAGVHPAAIYQPAVTKVLAWGTIRGMEVANAIVTQGSFTLWSALATFESTKTVSTLAFPDYVPSRFGPSYFYLSRVTFVFFLLLLTVLLLRRTRMSIGTVFLTLAAYGVGVAVLLTRILPRYFYFGVMFTAASLPWMPKKVGTITLVLLTATMLVSMWGSLALQSSWHPGLIPIFEPHRSWFNRITAVTLTSDPLVLIGGLLNTVALIALVVTLACQRTSTDNVR